MCKLINLRFFWMKYDLNELYSPTIGFQKVTNLKVYGVQFNVLS